MGISQSRPDTKTKFNKLINKAYEVAERTEANQNPTTSTVVAIKNKSTTSSEAVNTKSLIQYQEEANLQQLLEVEEEFEQQQIQQVNQQYLEEKRARAEELNESSNYQKVKAINLKIKQFEENIKN